MYLCQSQLERGMKIQVPPRTHISCSGWTFEHGSLPITVGEGNEDTCPSSYSHFL